MPAVERDELVVALFDVLGFGNRFAHLTLDEVYADYKQILRIATSKVSHTFFDARQTGDGTMTPFFGFVDIHHDYFSDTILLWNRFHPNTFKYFLHGCCALMCEALKARIPLRGAIGLGPAIMNKDAREYLGKPLVEADRAEKAQHWIGVSFAPSFDSRQDVPFPADLVRPYTKHRKTGKADQVLGLALDWPRTWRNEFAGSAVPALESLPKDSPVPNYYTTAIEFVRHSDDNPNWWQSYSGSPAL